MTEHKEVIFTNGWPKVLRYSSVMARLRAAAIQERPGDDVDPARPFLRANAARVTIETLESMYRALGNTCTTHGKLEDPILFSVQYDGEDKIAFACPQCSDPKLREQWEKEPPGWLGDPTA